MTAQTAAPGSNPARSHTSVRPPKVSPGSMAFWVIIVYGVIEYARPMDVFAPLAVIRPSLLMSVPLAIVLLQRMKDAPWTVGPLRIWLGICIFMALWIPLARNNYWAFGIWRVVFVTYLYAVAACLILDTPKRYHGFLQMWVLCAGFQGFWTLTHGGRGNGNFVYDENDAALYLGLGLSYSIFGAPVQRTFFWRMAFYASAVFCLGGIVASSSRGGFLALIACGGTIFWYSKKKVQMIALGILAVIGLMIFAPAEYWEDMQSINDTQDDTRLQRYEQWGVAWNMFLKNPVFGVGQGNVNWNYALYEEDDPNRRSLAGRAVHSMYFTAMPELGIVGCGLFIALGVALYRDISWLNKSPPSRMLGIDQYARATVAACACYLVGGVFISVLYYPHLYYMIAIVVAGKRLAVNWGPVLMASRGPERAMESVGVGRAREEGMRPPEPRAPSDRRPEPGEEAAGSASLSGLLGPRRRS